MRDGCLYPPEIVKSREILISMKYREAQYKPNLFYKWAGARAGEFTFFCDLRDYGYVSFWCKSDKEMPTWIENRVTYKEEVKLIRNGVLENRHSDNPCLNNEHKTSYYDHYALDYDPQFMNFEGDGYCIACGRDIEANEYFCNENCRLKVKKRGLELDIIHSETCEACKRWIVSNSEKYNDVVKLLPKLRDKVVLSKVIEHHTCYEKDIKMIVCVRCHAKIHSLDWCEYTPVDSRPLKDSLYKLVPCSSCSGMARVEIANPPNLVLCYTCKKKAERKDARMRKYCDTNHVGHRYMHEVNFGSATFKDDLSDFYKRM